MRTYYVYILSNRYRTVFYTGVTNNIIRRIGEHAGGQGSRFTACYRACELIYFETYGQIKDAIAREKEIKGWRREKKLDLIRTMNRDMADLSHLL